MRRRERVIIGVDMGTTSLKVCAFNDDCEPIAVAEAEYETTYPAPTHAEQDPARWWEAFKTVLNEIFSESEIDPAEVIAISMSSNYPTVVPISWDGDALLPALTWMDERAIEQCETVEDICGSSLYKFIRSELQPFSPLAKIRWIQENHPEVFHKTFKFVQGNGYMHYRLTGKIATDPAMASWFHIFDPDKLDWSDEICGHLQLPKSKLPGILRAWDTVGSVNENAAHETGLSPGTRVLVGTGDAIAAAFGMGVLENGHAWLTMGTGSAIGVLTEGPRFSPSLITEAYLDRNQYFLEGVMTSTGVAFKWFKNQLAYPEVDKAESLGIDPYEVMNREASKEPVGSGNLVFLPYLSGEQSPIADPNARGTIVGLSLLTTRAQIIRSIMEGCAYAIRHNVETIESLGETISEIRVTGGPTKSDTWNQILADVTGKTILTLEVNQAALLGNALLAQVNLGKYSDIYEAAKKMIKVRSKYMPRKEAKKVYDRLFQVYTQTYKSLKDLYPVLVNKEGQ